MKSLFPRFLLTIVVIGGSNLNVASGQRVNALLSEDTVRVGDRFTLTLIAIHGFDQAPSFPGTDSAFGDILPVNLLSAGSVVMDSDVRLDSAVYEVTTFALDTARLSPITIGFEDNSLESKTPAREIFVRSLVPGDAQQIRDMADPVEFGPPVLPFVLLGFAALIAAAILWYIIWRRKQPKPDVSPEPIESQGPPPSEVALKRLRNLENLPLTESSQVEFFYVELSLALRTYIEDRLFVPALESTTGELIGDLIHPDIQHKVPAGIPDQLNRILSLSDLFKFADVIPTVPEGRSAVQEAIVVVKRIEIKFDQRAASEELAPPKSR